jgi:hypothetical protein
MVCHQAVVPPQVAQPQAAQVQRQLHTQPRPAAVSEASAVPPVAAAQLVGAMPQKHHTRRGDAAVGAGTRAAWLLSLPPLLLLLLLPLVLLLFASLLLLLLALLLLFVSLSLFSLPHRSVHQQLSLPTGRQPQSSSNVEVHDCVCRRQQA